MDTNQSDSCNTVDPINPDEVFSILLASDIHLGYKEHNTERRDDSYDAFEEVLQIAVARNVDFILLGGDLFDKANPSSYCLNRCMALLRSYCMGGDKPILFEFLSDQSVNFAESLNKTVNYEDENLNISIPVFSIHGNHDDPSGFGALSALDLLSTSGLINYFGKLTDLQNLEVNPIMLRKGDTKITIYGMSYIQDNRLTRLFDDKKVKMALPEDDASWFNIFVLHQNRANRGVKNYLPEESIPGFLDLILWGHEHDCRIVPEQNPYKKFYVCQPGSTVATSLADGEAGVKQCAVLQIYKKNFKVEPIPLKTVRPFIFDTLSIGQLMEEDDEFMSVGAESIQEKVKRLAREKVEEMLKKAEKLRTGHPKQPKLPLLRLRIDVTDVNQMFQSIRFGQEYAQVVANCEDMITFKRQMRRQKDDVKLDSDAMEEAYLSEKANQVNKVEDVVKRYFDEVEDDSKKLQVLLMEPMTELTRHVVNGVSRTDHILDFYLTEGMNFIENCTEDEIDGKLQEFRAAHDQTFKKLLLSLDEVKKREPMDFDEEINSDDEQPVQDQVKTAGGRGRGRGAKANTNTTTTSSRGRGRGSRGGRGGRGAAASSSRKQQLDVSVSKTRGASKTTNQSIYISDSD